MRWILVDLLLVLLALLVLGLCGLRLWGRVKALGRRVADAGTAVGAASERLAAVQADGQGVGQGGAGEAGLQAGRQADVHAGPRRPDLDGPSRVR